MAFKAVHDYPGRFAIMGSLPLDDPGSRGKIAGWRAWLSAARCFWAASS